MLSDEEKPVVIPIHSKEGDGDIPEWAMLELNGELLLPKDFLPTTNDGKENPATSVVVTEDSLELGSVRFINNVRRKRVHMLKTLLPFEIFSLGVSHLLCSRTNLCTYYTYRNPS